MSRIGKLPINLPKGVTITIKDNLVTVKGPKGELKQKIHPEIEVEVEENTVRVLRPNDERQNRAMHGLYRSLINNMVVGVSEGYSKTLELVGVGYRVSNNGQVLEFSLGYTHNIFLKLPSEIKVDTKSERNQNPLVILESCDMVSGDLVERLFETLAPYATLYAIYDSFIPKRYRSENDIFISLNSDNSHYVEKIKGDKEVRNPNIFNFLNKI